MKCLVVDPSATRRRILINTIRDQQPFEFVEAAAVGPALQSVGDGVDLVLTEWNLPDRSGLELIRELRARTETAGVPVIMVTARNSRDDVSAAIEAGVTSYVTRPFSKAILRSHLIPYLPLDLANETVVTAAAPPTT